MCFIVFAALHYYILIAGMKIVVFLVLQTTFLRYMKLYISYIPYIKHVPKTICFIVFPALADRKRKHSKNHYTNMMFYIDLWRKYKKVMLKPIRFPYVLNS